MVYFKGRSVSFIWWKPLSASRTEKYLAPCRRDASSTIVFIIWCSRLMVRFRPLGSIHILTLLSLTTVSRLLTQSVGSYTFAIIPFCSMQSSSVFTISDGNCYWPWWVYLRRYVSIHFYIVFAFYQSDPSEQIRISRENVTSPCCVVYTLGLIQISRWNIFQWCLARLYQ